MKTAFSCWNNRIAPVFDVARQLLLVESDDGRVLSEARETMPVGDQMDMVRLLESLGVGTLVCGAISRPMQELVLSCGISVTPFVAGDLHEVVKAWIDGRIQDDIFAMPGCCRRGRRSRGEDPAMRAGRGRCITGGAPGAGAGGLCLCPLCSYREPHEAGVPCSRKLCPLCGSALIRG